MPLRFSKIFGTYESHPSLVGALRNMYSFLKNIAVLAMEFSEADLNVSLVQEGRGYSEHFQMYKFYFSMRMAFSQDGDSVIFVGDLLNVHGDALD